MSFPPAPAPAKKPSMLSLANLKKYRWPALAALLTGGPFAYFEGDDWVKDAGNMLPAWTASAPAAPRATSSLTGVSTTSAGQFGAFPTGASDANAPTSIPEVFNFDVTPAWVASRWSEVSLGMADVSLTGHRVMLVTGPQPEDLAGSLTYYFDQGGTLQRIRFEGVSGDTRPLVAQMAMRYRFVRCRTDVPGAEIYQVHYDGKATGDLRIRSAPMVRANSTLGRYSVSLAIDRPTY